MVGPVSSSAAPSITNDGACGDATRSVLVRLAAIIEAFDDDRLALTLRELTLRTGLPRSTVYRMAEQLCALGWLERERGDYRVGVKMFELGGLATRRNQLCDSAYAHLVTLAAHTGLTVQLAILDGPEVVYLERLPAKGFELPTRDGGRMPAYCTALGKAMLAFQPDAMVSVREFGMSRRTDATICSERDLEAELGAVRRSGVAVDRQESYDGIGCVAAPICNSGRAIGAVSITGPIDGMELRAIGPQVKRAALSIWNERFGVSTPQGGLAVGAAACREAT